ncbi:amidohydrolase family protein [Pseudonocardia hispaniensis]|uniref:Amidohydrolase family protein n=1 Tax=Pseudonocardia hispaniensis TaxID=904933 RepID=A0ABW1J4S0_9PSEU
MYCVASERYAVVDAQVHAWDGSPHNQAGPSGEEFVAELYRRHRLLDRSPRPVAADEFARVTEAGLIADVLGGHVDRGVLQPVVLDELFVLGFSPAAWNAEFAEQLPGRFVLTGELDPSLGSAGARGLAARVRNGDLRGLHLAPARRPNGRLGLAEPWLRRVLARCEQSGAAVVHLGVGPSAPAGADGPDWMVRATTGSAAVAGPRWPEWADPVRAGSALPVRTRAAQRPAGIRFDPAELRELARALPRVQFVLGAACLPTTQLCRLARLPNVHVLLTDLLAGLRIRPLEAARALGTLLEAFGGHRLLFGSGYPMLRPGRLVAEFAAFRFPAELRGEYAELDVATRHAILGGNAARLYRIPLPVGSTAPQLALRRPGAGS